MSQEAVKIGQKKVEYTQKRFTHLSALMDGAIFTITQCDVVVEEQKALGEASEAARKRGTKTAHAEFPFAGTP